MQQIEGIALVRSGGLGKDWGYPGMDTTSIIGGPADRTIPSLVLWEGRYFCRSQRSSMPIGITSKEAVEPIDASNRSEDQRGNP